jgi:hypothetical protein
MAAMIRVRRGAEPFFAALPAIAAAAGCLLPWENLVVRPLGEAHARSIGSFHGSGLAACIGAGLALLMLADRLLRPQPSLIRDAGIAFAGALLVTGTALFTSSGGYPPASADAYDVTIQPGLYISGGAGVLLVLTSLPAAWSRRGGSRSPASSGAPAPR